MRITAIINNVPKDVQNGKYDGWFMVVRRDENNASLWYYGIYEDDQKAMDVAVKIGNGIVVQIGEVDG